jgi:hypothetical protein
MAENETEIEAQEPSRFQIPPALRQAAEKIASGDMQEAPIAMMTEALVEKVNNPEEVVVQMPDAEAPVEPQMDPPEANEGESQEEQSFENPVEDKVPAVPLPTKVIIKNEINDIPIDLNNLEVFTTSALTRSGAIDRILKSKSTFMVTLPQSAYVAKMSSLNLEDKIRILNSVETPFENRRKLYKMVYDHIEEMSITKPKFDQWIKMTSYHDVDTLLFGIYAQTYPGESDFDITCGKCENKVEAKIGAHLLSCMKDKDIYQHLDAVVQSNDPARTQAASMVHNTSRVLLPDSKLIFDIITPSIADHLMLLKAFNPKAVADISNIVGMMLFLKQIFIPDMAAFNQNKKAAFFMTEDRNEMLRIISNLSTKDGDKLNDEINERAKKYEINYQLPKMTCASCGNEIEAINIDCESILFSSMMGKI